MAFTISKKTKWAPNLPFETMKNAVLGRSYTLSLIFIGETRARTLNREYRNATYVPNVLSFPLEKNMGEIYITPSVAKREAKSLDLSTTNYIGYLFIHGLLHLKGHAHGDTMDKAEKRYMRRFGLR